MPSQVMSLLHEHLSDHMDEILKCFKPGALITIVVRNPKYGDADVMMGNDDPNAVIESIQKMKDREPTFRQGDPIPIERAN